MARRILLVLCAALALLGLARAQCPLPQCTAGTVDLLGYKLPTRQRCGQGVWLAMKIIPRSFGNAEELYCGFENPDYQVAGFTIQERVTRFKHFNANKYYMKLVASPDRVAWEWGKQGAPFVANKEFLLKAKVALNKTNVVASSYTWNLLCEWKWLNATTGEEVYETVPFEKTATVSISGCK